MKLGVVALTGRTGAWGRFAGTGGRKDTGKAGRTTGTGGRNTGTRGRRVPGMKADGYREKGQRIPGLGAEKEPVFKVILGGCAPVTIKT